MVTGEIAQADNLALRTLIVARLRTPAAESPAAQATGAAPSSDYDLNANLRPIPGRTLTPAAVLVPLVERPAGFTVLLTRRTDHLHDHAGQVSFPGGRVEAGDESPMGTALRETEEEIGLPRELVRVAGMLDAYETVTGFLVTPVVGFVDPGFELSPDPFEVAEIFEVPLAFLLDPANHQRHSRIRSGRRRHYYVFEYGRHYIWGATAGMLVNLCRRMRNKP
jgi:8-oxo-dGTP pyrophosphatase MutT (NUDIX family)